MRYRYMRVEQTVRDEVTGARRKKITFQVWDRQLRAVAEYPREREAKRKVLELNGDLKKVQVEQQSLF